MSAHPYRARPIGRTSDWLTPLKIVRGLGHFDLDPCASLQQPWQTADKQLTIEEDGLASPWVGRVWLNPPYGRETATWLKRLADHGNGVALVFARTETKMFFESVWPRAHGALFMEGRPHFHHAVTGERAAGNSGGPLVLVAYGANNLLALKLAGVKGMVIDLKTD